MSISSATSGTPAILGGEPVFANKLPIVRPVLPQLDELEPELRAILSSGMVTKGGHLRAFEEAMAAHLCVRHAIAVSSCTSGLMLVYQALGLQGEVVVPSYTFMASVSSLVWAGLTPVFADVERETTNLDPAAAAAALTPKASAILAVHNFGTPADIAGLQALADKHGLRLIFDAAHAFGSLYQGEPIGGQADANVFSLSPTKLVVASEGGIVATNDDELAGRVRTDREYGMVPGYNSASAGINARMSEFHALLGKRSLEKLPAAVARRAEVAATYRERLDKIPGVAMQEVRKGDRSSYKDFAMFIEPERFGLDRDQLVQALAADNVDTRTYYTPPVHRQTAYQQYAPDEQRLANTNWLCERVVCLPIYSDMNQETVTRICTAIERIHEHADEVRQSVTTVASQV